MPFSSLPFDILLVIFRELDVVGFIRLGMTCKGLYQIARDRQVWADQLEKLRHEDPVLKPATPPLASLTTEELQTFVTNRTKLHLRSGNGHDNFGFATKGITEISGARNILLLPGGKSLLAIDNHKGVTLCQVDLVGGQASLSVTANVKFSQNTLVGLGHSKLITTMAPCPILVHDQRSNKYGVQIVKVDHHNSTMSLETSLCLPRRFLKADGQERVISFLVHQPFAVVVIHLDHPGVVLESDNLPARDPGAYGPYYPWSICMPTESLAIIYNLEKILVCKIPNFSELSPGTHALSAIPMRSWPGLDRFIMESRAQIADTASETVYNPQSAREFDLHYVLHGPPPRVVTVTVPINTGDDSGDERTYEPDELSALKQEVVVVEKYGEKTTELRCHKELYFDMTWSREGVQYMAMPLKNLPLRGPNNIICMSVSREEFKRLTPQMDMDEASGRVVFWGCDEHRRETKILVGNLV